MAGLTPGQQPIPAAAQFKAVAYLRWRLFANSFRRKEGIGELAAKIIVYPVALLIVAGPVAAATFGSYAAIRRGRPDLMALTFWFIFLLQIVVSINISPPGLSFDPESLIRFPLSFPRYLTIRLFLGLLSASTIAGTLALLGAAAGVSFADPTLAPVAFAAAMALAATNMFFVRMVFAWVDRWLSTRRAREAFTAIILIGTVVFQYVNVTFNGLGRHSSRATQAAKIARVEHFYHAAQPFLMHLPPGLAAASLIDQSLHAPALAILQICGVLLFGAFFLAVFAWRMQFEYRGENLSEANVTPPAAATHVLVDDSPQRTFGLPPIVAACLQKEFIYLRRNVSQFYGILVPLAMVFIFAGRAGSFTRTGLIFPAAVVYSFLGIAALSYNILGLDATGVQAYFLAPLRIRSVFLAKNLFHFALAALQITLIYVLLCFTSGPPATLIAVETACWLLFATFANVALGNWRSITSSKKVDPNKVARKQASQLSALISIGVMILAAGIGAGLYYLAGYLKLPWLPIPVLLALSAVSVSLYLLGLARVDALAYKHRETLLEELCKAS